ncbi:hypothetical protein [cf. Phormidesmis sp. LEGE 11477]|uniref:hypothetical protein n=1 Tax=cf. Phormidesmis sp. LEGE 11477 TaxID=1828680 RepID=UPI001882E099|nr:hypothetical protein [cf. Phormidesmis sp. LEGE 11477]MBE9061856.1 hypothetical protein [cf. Phormidesmis sp. LEGE 11477]
MGIIVTASNLSSRTIRQSVTQNSGGIRKLSTLNRFLSNSEQDDTGGILGFFQKVFRFSVKGAGWIATNLLKLGSLTFTSAWGWLVNTSFRVVNFDWNASDEELKQLVQGSYTAAAATWGAFVGSALGWTAGIGLGYGVSMLVPVIGGAVLAKYVAGRVAQEAIEEVSQKLFQAIAQTFQLLVDQTSISLYINSRKFLKRRRDLLPENLREIVDEWGSDNGPRVTIAESFEERLETLPLVGQIFAEEAVDEFFDSFIEAGFIVAGELDAAVEAAKNAKTDDPERGILLYPDRDNPNDKIVLVGNQNELIPHVQGVLANRRALENKDVGDIAAVPMHEVVTPATSRYTLTIHYNEFEKPPFTRLGRRGKTAKLKVSDSELGITFNQLKIAFKPYTWGGIRATTQLDNGRQLAVYAISDAECNDMIQSLLSFTSAEATRTVYTNVNSGVSANQRKESVRLYPVKATMATRSLNQVSGRFDIETQTMFLWRDQPVGIDRFGVADQPQQQG